MQMVILKAHLCHHGKRGLWDGQESGAGDTAFCSTGQRHCVQTATMGYVGRLAAAQHWDTGPHEQEGPWALACLAW
jgi:hypothetical protein